MVESNNHATIPFVLAPDEARGPGGGPWRTRFTGADTAGMLSLGEAVMPPMSAGPSLHVHSREDEASIVIKGVLTVQVGTEQFEVPAGGVAWLPRGVPHTFANLTTEPVHVVGVIVPAGLEGMFEEQSAYFASLQGPPDPAAIAEIGARYGVTVIGGPIEVPERS